MGSCHIAHDCNVGSNNIFANNTLLAGHVVVEDYVHTAGAVVIHQFCHLGSHSFIGGGSVISQDVPKYMMVSGERAELRGLISEGLRRHGFSHTEIQGMRKAYRKIFMPSEGNLKSIEDRLSDVEQNEELASIPAVCSMLQHSQGEHRRLHININITTDQEEAQLSTCLSLMPCCPGVLRSDADATNKVSLPGMELAISSPAMDQSKPATGGGGFFAKGVTVT